MAVDTQSLVEMNQMRRCVHRRAESGLHQNRLEHGAGGALAIGPAHHDGRHAEADALVCLGETHQARHTRHALKPKVNRPGMKRFNSLEPVIERQ